MSTSAEAPNAQAKSSALRNPVVRAALLLGGVILLAVVIVAAFDWWTHGRFVQSTNDAYLQADAVTVAPKVQGYVDRVFVADNQAVRVGDPLLKIDTSSYDATLAQQTATVTARQADIAAAQGQVAQQQAMVDQTQAQLAGAQANAAYSAGEAARYARLSAQGVETDERAAQARNQHDQAAATVRADLAAGQQAQRQLATLRAQVEQSRAQLQAAQAQSRAAQINLGDTLIRASISGRIGDKTVRAGQFVQPGLRLMSVVPVRPALSGGQLQGDADRAMRVGQKARVRIDALGGRDVGAVLESFAPGTGAQFALLPAQNATGNFTKIVQRVPVRIRLQAPAAMRDRLVPGLSATVNVDTYPAPGPRS